MNLLRCIGQGNAWSIFEQSPSLKSTNPTLVDTSLFSYLSIKKNNFNL